MNFEDYRLLFSNHIINATMLAWFIAQFLKLFTFYGDDEKFKLSRMFTSGGMPSSHSAGMTAMTIMVLRICGIESPEFAISLLVSIVVMYDARGVRRETGEHATIINKMISMSGDNDNEFGDINLKELIGHTPFQVLMGALLGLIIGICYQI